MKSDEIDYEIFGEDLQFVEIELDPGETVIAEAGSMMFMDKGVSFEAKMGDGSNPTEGFFGKVAVCQACRQNCSEYASKLCIKKRRRRFCKSSCQWNL